jgi:uncharacterized membrane protein
MNRILVYLALAFDTIGIVWGIIVNFQNHTLGQFFGQTQWPIFIGFILLIIAVFNGLFHFDKFDKSEKHETSDPNKNNPFLP